jgi:carboxypeptidase C (cathepsin A)
MTGITSKRRACPGHAWARRGALGTMLLFGAQLTATSAAPVSVQAPPAPSLHWLPGVVTGDEAIAVTQHHIKSAHGTWEYEARAGRLPIRSQETGEIRGYVFFTAYLVQPSAGKPRPLTFIWNGGPTIASDFIHFGGLGPRRRTKDGMVDNPDTPLATSDLVFYDPIETGFSRPAKPEFAAEFLNMQGDVAATAEFIRAYRARFHALDQPLFVCGESYGVFRAAALSDFMTERGDKLAGTILISGDIPNIPQSIAFYDAMHVPARTATAFYHHLLAPDLMKDRDATMKEVDEWVVKVYRPALEGIDHLDTAERDKVATELARYTGIRADQVDRKTLVVHLPHYLALISGADESHPILVYDTRSTGALEPGSPRTTGDYFRAELGYDTDLTYNTLEKGYTPTPGHPARTTGEQWYYNQPGLTDADWARTMKEGEVTLVARDNPPWIVNALTREKDLRVFVSTGRYDAMNMCEGDVLATETLAKELSQRIENHCYEAGHITYLDDAARVKILGDISTFIGKTVAAQAETAAKP